MEVEIDLRKGLEENASDYFEKSKRAKRKLQGLLKAIEATEQKARKAEAKKPEAARPSKKKKLQWFHAFHWFRSSNSLLVVAGRSAKSNEQLVKRHLAAGDIFLHADIQGGAACIVKSDGKTVPPETMKEAAQFAASLSKAWQQGFAAVDVYAVPKEQVSKSAPSGEALGTGSFMIYGKRQWFRKTKLQYAIGLVKEGASFYAMGGPPSAVKKHSLAAAEVVQGKGEKSGAAKKLLALFEKKAGRDSLQLDEVVAALPSNGVALEERF